MCIRDRLFALGLAIPWAVTSAARANSRIDKGLTMTSFAAISLPSFATAVLLYYVFSVKLDWLPDTYNAIDPFWGFSHDHRLIQLILPALTLGIGAAAQYARLLRTDMITTLREDFILMAKSKGVPRKRVLYIHALRSSLFSLITLLAINVGFMIGGSIVVESFFRIPGIGLAIIEAVLRDDFPVVLAIVMLVSCGFMVLNYLADILYSVLDPRIRNTEQGQQKKVTIL